jgi:DNA-binding response OmpR family regulator
MRILLIEDDQSTAHTIKDELSAVYTVDICFNASDGYANVQAGSYDLIIIDYLLPDGNGIDLCKKIRVTLPTVPILMLTGRQDINDKVNALDSGSDDYLTKPFSFAELKARIRALMRRNIHILHSGIMTVGDLTVDMNSRIVTRANKPILLRRKEFDLLEYFIRNQGKVVTRSMIQDHVWDNAYESLTNTIDVHVKYLRDSLDKPFKKKLIKTIYGVGLQV